MNSYNNINFESTSALTVSELNEYARRLLAGDPLLRSVQVTGEISGYKHHYSGHRYFTLKDDSSKVQCVMFRQAAMGLDFQPCDGMQVTVSASASIFPRDGSYQLYVNTMQKAGKGDLYAKFEKLKSKLASEGLFDPAIKKSIPVMPSKIGIVTSETGAAIRDIIHVARRRNPGIGILIAPCAVQGASAAAEIVSAIERLNQNGECDVILVGRGGGSIEDLWSFNEEIVARAIFASKIPVISCVGHEIDFTISDFVADLRAPTPSAAAELAVPVLGDVKDELNAVLKRLGNALNYGVQVRKMRLDSLERGYVFREPVRVLLSNKAETLERLSEQLNKNLNISVEACHNRLNALDIALRTLDPASVLDRGYAIIESEKGIITDIENVFPGQNVNIRLSDGSFDARVEQINRKVVPDEKED